MIAEIDMAPSDPAPQNARGKRPIAKRLIGWLRAAFHAFEIGDLLHLIAGTSTFAAAASAILGFLAWWLNSRTILIGSNILFLLLFLALAVFSYRQRARLRTRSENVSTTPLPAAPEAPADAKHLADTQSALTAAQATIAQLRMIERHILNRIVQCSHFNASCDHELFSNFYRMLPKLDTRSSPAARQFRISGFTAALNVTAKNMSDILDHVVAVFGLYTGHSCNATLKIPSVNRNNELIVVSFARDSFSSATRGKADESDFLLATNTAFDEIENRGCEVYMNNDLVAAARDGKYRNPRPGWEKDYTATLVLPINRNNNTPYHLTGSATTIRSQGYICVDNMFGRFDGEICVSFLRSISWRLSIMMHRWVTLDSSIRELAGVR